MLSLLGIDGSGVASNKTQYRSRAELDAAVETSVHTKMISATFGAAMTWFMSMLFGTEERNILMLGLDSAGKTTVLHRLVQGERSNTIPTIGFNVEQVQYNNLSFTMWDMGGQEKIRRLWQRYYDDVDAIIFVVDASDRTRIGEAVAELNNLLVQPQLKGATVLVLANKQDIPNALSAAELMSELQLSSKAGTRDWYVQKTVATDGTGLKDGLKWLSRALLKDKPIQQALISV
jgi:small GTP-binding protein